MRFERVFIHSLPELHHGLRRRARRSPGALISRDCLAVANIAEAQNCHEYPSSATWPSTPSGSRPSVSRGRRQFLPRPRLSMRGVGIRREEIRILLGVTSLSPRPKLESAGGMHCCALRLLRHPRLEYVRRRSDCTQPTHAPDRQG
jgi:hypothetical protein